MIEEYLKALEKKLSRVDKNKEHDLHSVIKAKIEKIKQTVEK